MCGMMRMHMVRCSWPVWLAGALLQCRLQRQGGALPVHRQPQLEPAAAGSDGGPCPCRHVQRLSRRLRVPLAGSGLLSRAVVNSHRISFWHRSAQGEQLQLAESGSILVFLSLFLLAWLLGPASKLRTPFAP
jgi:hypothetical protein